MSEERLTFDNGAGLELAARLTRPDGPVRARALFAHCFTCTKDLKSVRHICQALAAAGIATLRFDFTGLGESEGEFADTTFSSNVDDLVAAAGFLAAEHGGEPELLIGHSLGGAAVLMAAGRIDGCRAVATIASPCDPEHVTELLNSSREEIERDGEAEVQLAGRSFTIRRQFLDDLEEVRMRETIGDLRRALLVLHAPFDEIVDVDNAARIFQAAKHPKSFISLDDADHLLRDEADGRYAGTVIAAWAQRYLAAADLQEQTPAPEDSKEGEEGAVVVDIGKTPYRSDIVAAGHGLVADEPRADGGGNLGPAPYDLLLASLGACTAMTLRMYADHKGWDLEHVRVHLRHEKIHARDCEDCESKQGRVDHIRRDLEVAGDLDESQRTRLLEIADRCPVHRTLHGEIKVDTDWAGQDAT